jgi:hypothetical protein
MGQQLGRAARRQPWGELVELLQCDAHPLGLLPFRLPYLLHRQAVLLRLLLSPVPRPGEPRNLGSYKTHRGEYC